MVKSGPVDPVLLNWLLTRGPVDYSSRHDEIESSEPVLLIDYLAYLLLIYCFIYLGYRHFFKLQNYLILFSVN